jgi:hypothetical protein
MDNQEIQEIRKLYTPESIRFLMVGESTPPSGNFFYDSKEERIFTSITRKAFTAALGTEYATVAEFLEDFKTCEFFLDELYLRPIDEIPPETKEEEKSRAIEHLSRRLAQYQPERLLVLSVEIEEAVREAAMKANLGAIIERSYYLGNSYLYEFHAGLVGWFSDINNRAFST